MKSLGEVLDAAAAARAAHEARVAADAAQKAAESQLAAGLAPCPVCGRVDTIQVDTFQSSNRCRVSCDSLSVLNLNVVPVVQHDISITGKSAVEAINRWNTLPRRGPA